MNCHIGRIEIERESEQSHSLGSTGGESQQGLAKRDRKTHGDKCCEYYGHNACNSQIQQADSKH